MYTRIPTGRYPRGMRVPENYGGSAFRPLSEETPDAQTPKSPPAVRTTASSSAFAPSEPLAVRQAEQDGAQAEAPSVPSGRFSLGLPFLSRDGTGIGFEELLLIGLILLIAQDEQNQDLVWLLVLLLLIS